MPLQPEFLDGLVPLAFVLVVMFVTFGFIAVVVYLEHRKEMALIEAGEYGKVEDSRAWILAVGLLLVAIGVGSVVESVLAGGVVGEGITAALVGVAALVYYWIKRRQTGTTVEDGDANRST